MLKQNHVAHVPVPDERSFRETLIFFFAQKITIPIL